MANRENKRGVQARDVGWKDFPLPTGSDNDAKCAYLTAVYNHTVETAKDAIGWYLINKVPQKRWARTIRLAAIFFTTIGGLIPLIAASKVLTMWTVSTTNSNGAAGTIGIEFSQFGYVALALAGACILLDKYFGFSSAWIRYLTTATMLQRLLHEFCLDWAALDVCREGQAPQFESLLRRAQTFITRVRTEVEKETADWAAEYRTNLAEMEKSVREQLDANRPGSIALTVANVSKATEGGVTVLLDGATMQKIDVPDCLLAPVFPGEHVVTIRGKVKDALRSLSTPARVEPGRPHLLTLKLPEGDA
jgi:hypothetical protein